MTETTLHKLEEMYEELQLEKKNIDNKSVLISLCKCKESDKVGACGYKKSFQPSVRVSAANMNSIK